MGRGEMPGACLAAVLCLINKQTNFNVRVQDHYPTVGYLYDRHGWFLSEGVATDVMENLWQDRRALFVTLTVSKVILYGALLKVFPKWCWCYTVLWCSLMTAGAVPSCGALL